MKIYFASIFLLCSVITFSQETLLTINDTKIASDEFIKVYQKNSKIRSIEGEKTMDEYLQLFIDYKLKVMEAEKQRLDTTAGFKNEYFKYVTKLAIPNLRDTVLEEKIKKEAFERMKYIINTRHILVGCPPHFSPEDTLMAYEKALKIRESLLSGADFEKTARASSDDSKVHENGGHKGYMHVFKEEYPYENAAFSLDKGTISYPIRTKKGYHIIQVLDKKKLKGDYIVAHIMLIYADRMQSNKKELQARADSIIDLLNKGANFGELAKKHSGDTRSSENGGILPPLDMLLNLPFEFKLRCWELKEIGEYTKEPVETAWGFHVVQLVKIQDFASYDDMKIRLEKTLETAPIRGKMIEESYIAKLKEDLNYKIYPGVIEHFKSKIDSTLIDGKWEINKKKFQKTIYVMSAGNTKISEYDMAQFIYQNQYRSRRIKSVPILIDKYLQEYEKTFLLKEGMDKLRKTNPQFASTAQEYYDGMMLFEITQKEVWDKANADSIGLEKFYETIKNSYMHKERAEVITYNCKNKEVRELLIKLLDKKAKKNYTAQDITNILNKKDTNNVAFTVHVFEKGENKEIDSLSWKAGAVKQTGEASLYEITKITPPAPKELHEVRGYVVSDYQKHLEEKWIEQLKKVSTIHINQEAFSKIKAEIK